MQAAANAGQSGAISSESSAAAATSPSVPSTKLPETATTTLMPITKRHESIHEVKSWLQKFLTGKHQGVRASALQPFFKKHFSCMLNVQKFGFLKLSLALKAWNDVVQCQYDLKGALILYPVGNPLPGVEERPRPISRPISESKLRSQSSSKRAAKRAAAAIAGDPKADAHVRVSSRPAILQQPASASSSVVISATGRAETSTSLVDAASAMTTLPDHKSHIDQVMPAAADIMQTRTVANSVYAVEVGDWRGHASAARATSPATTVPLALAGSNASLDSPSGPSRASAESTTTILSPVVPCASTAAPRKKQGRLLESDVKAWLATLLADKPLGLHLSCLQNCFTRQFSTPIDYSRFGYPKLSLALKEWSDVVQCRYNNKGEIMIYAANGPLPSSVQSDPTSLADFQARLAMPSVEPSASPGRAAPPMPQAGAGAERRGDVDAFLADQRRYPSFRLGAVFAYNSLRTLLRKTA